MFIHRSVLTVELDVDNASVHEELLKNIVETSYKLIEWQPVTTGSKTIVYFMFHSSSNSNELSKLITSKISELLNIDLENLNCNISSVFA